MSDLISRDEAIKAIKKRMGNKPLPPTEIYTYFGCIDEIKAIPSAETTGALDDAIAKYVADGLMELPSAEAVQGCDGCRYNTRIPQEQCLRCGRYWRDGYTRKGGDDE